MITNSPLSGSFTLTSASGSITGTLYPTGSTFSVGGNYNSGSSIAYFNGSDTPIAIFRPRLNYGLRVKRLNPKARLPEKAHSTDLGYDLFTSEPVTLQPGAQVKIPTGIACNFPYGYGALIRDRSSIASKECFITGGVIDNGYTGEIIIMMRNLSHKRVNFGAGDKVAQMLLMPVISTEIEEVDGLDETDRGAKGFGSSDWPMINNQKK